MFAKYYKEIECPKQLIDTSEFNVYDMNQKILSVILKELP